MKRGHKGGQGATIGVGDPHNKVCQVGTPFGDPEKAPKVVLLGFCRVLQGIAGVLLGFCRVLLGKCRVNVGYYRVLQGFDIKPCNTL